MSVSPANPSVPPAASPVLPPPSPPRAAMTTPVPPSVPPVAAEPPEVPAEPVDDSDGESVDVAGEVNNLPELDDLPADVSAASEVPAAQEPTFFLPVSAGTILTPYSESADVFYEYLREWRYHPGIDLETNAGALVQSAADGVVKEVIESADRNMGVTVVVKHGADFETVYSNLMDMVKVTAGQTVAAGETIAAVGDTAVSELALPAHLHFEILRDGVPVDPADYLPEIP
jgi:murein DD-endopeptidase MepM/ murein hydrolase activator NlpD